LEVGLKELHITVTILGGLLVGIISALLGVWIGSRGSVGNPVCLERRASCMALINEKIDSLSEKLDSMLHIIEGIKELRS